MHGEFNERVEAATSTYSATTDLLQDIYSVLVAKNLLIWKAAQSDAHCTCVVPPYELLTIFLIFSTGLVTNFLFLLYISCAYCTNKFLRIKLNISSQNVFVQFSKERGTSSLAYGKAWNICQNDPSTISGLDQKFNITLPNTFDCSDKSLLPLR